MNEKVIKSLKDNLGELDIARNHDFELQVVFEDEWQNKINAMMQYD